MATTDNYSFVKHDFGYPVRDDELEANLDLIDTAIATRPSTATFVVSASNSLHKERADYVCDGTADDVQIQDAINALPTTGGKIILMTGEYILAGHIVLDAGVTLQGQGANNTILNSKSIAATSISDVHISTLQVKNSNTHCINFQNVSNGSIKYCIIENAMDDGIAIAGSGTSNVIIQGNVCKNNVTSLVPSGIELDGGARKVKLIENTCYGNGNSVTGWGGGITIHTHPDEPDIKNIIVENNLCYDNTTNIWVDNDQAAVTIEKITFAGNVLYGGTLYVMQLEKICDSVVENNIIDGGIFYITSTSERIVIANNIFTETHILSKGAMCSFMGNSIYATGSNNHALLIRNQSVVIGNTITNAARSGVRAYADASGSIISNNIIMNCGQAGTDNKIAISISDIEDVIISDNRCGDNQGVKTQEYGIYISNCDYVHVNNNILLDNSISPIYNTANANGRIESNIGYITKNSGTSTGTGAQQTIAYGLAATPTKVILWNIEEGANPYQSAAVDATNIYITASINQDYGWQAEVV